MTNKNKKEKTNIRRGIRGIWRHTKEFKKELIIISILGIVSSAANGAVPFVTGKFFDSLISLSNENPENVMGWVTILIILATVQIIATNFDWIMEKIHRTVATKVHVKVESNGLNKLLRLPITFHKDNHIQEILHKIETCGWRTSTVIRNVMHIAPQLLSIFIGIVLAMSINVTLASILLVGVFVYVVLLINMLRPMARIDEESHKIWNETWDNGASLVNQIDIVKQAATEDFENKNLESNFMNKVATKWLEVEMNWVRVEFFQRTVVLIVQLAIFALSVKFISEGIITVGELVALNGYSMMFFGPFVQMGYNWQVIQNGITSAAGLEDVYEYPNEKYNPTGSKEIKLKGEIEFQDVVFHYESDKEKAALEDVNFSVNPGEVIALVGESGSGKSTTISLLSAYYFPQKGQVLIGGISTDKLNLTNLRKQIAVVPQEISLFNETIEFNIKYGSPSATKEQVIKATKQAHLYDYIETLPDKFETVVGERGVKLSVGQKQRVAIARAILQDPKILVLDEPTSALDAITEKKISESLEELMKGRTTFIIAHRLSTVRKADKIIVFEKGKIVEEGNHIGLLKKRDGYYKKLHDYQIGLY